MISQASLAQSLKTKNRTTTTVDRRIIHPYRQKCNENLKRLISRV